MTQMKCPKCGTLTYYHAWIYTGDQGYYTKFWFECDNCGHKWSHKIDGDVSLIEKIEVDENES